MPKLDLTADEVKVILTAIETEIKSAKRAQNNAKNPGIAGIYQHIEAELQGIKGKIATAK